MYHCLTVHIYQPPSDAFELSEEIISEGCGQCRSKPYKLKQIYIPMGLSEFVDVPVCHPLRCHREVIIIHCHPQQRQHVWMAESFPRYNLLAEPLQWSASTHNFRQTEYPHSQSYQSHSLSKPSIP